MKKYFDVILIALMFILMATVANGQTECPDLEIAKVTNSLVKSPNNNLNRYRFVVAVKNITKVDYVPNNAPAITTINLSFSAKGVPNKIMATQSLPQLSAGATVELIFEVNVNKDSLTLPDWDNMPMPIEYCGFINTGKEIEYECSIKNNKLCKTIKQKNYVELDDFSDQ
jgi:hypothetical protein